MSRRAAWALALSLLVAGATSAPVAAHAQEAPAGLASELDALLAGTEAGVLVREGDQVLYAHAAERPLLPASTLKLLTTSCALARLGPEFRFRTRLVASGPIVDGVLQGDLWVVGGGDPTISARFDPDPLLDPLAVAALGAGISRVTGDLVTDDRVFEAGGVHPGWDDDDAEHWYGAEVAGLALNDDCVDVIVRGSAEGPVVTLRPDTRYVQVDLRAASVQASKQHSWGVVRTGDKRTLRITGKVWARAQPYTASVPVRDPVAFFGAVLAERLAARGVALGGAVRRPRADEEPAAARELWARETPLQRVLEVTNQHSQNFYAECLLKTLAVARPDGSVGRGGSWTAGSAALAAWVQGLGVPADEVTIADGSGLSRQNHVSARAIASLLASVLAGPQADAFRATLAEPGEEGTLRRRLRDLPAGVEFRGKTGTLTGVHALAGELRAGSRRVVFAALLEGKGASRQTLDRLAVAIARRLAR